MELLLIGLNHKTAPVELRERVSAIHNGELLGEVLSWPEVEEALLLSTCNRFEILMAVAGDTAPTTLESGCAALLALKSGVEVERLNGALYRHWDREARFHLMRTAASLDSLVLGEPQILGQVKRAYDQARGVGAVGKRLNRTMQQVLRAAKRARRECEMGRAAVSVGSIAAALAQQIFSDLRRSDVALIGAGKMIAQAAGKLESAGARSITVVNRSVERARELARPRGWEVCPLAELPEILAATDIVISSTASPERLVTVEMVRAAQQRRRYRPLFIVDIAVPRDVAPEVGALERVYLYNIDDLSSVSAENQRNREQAAASAARCLDQEARRFARQERVEPLGPVIRALRESFLEVADNELKRTERRLKHLSADDREALRRMSKALVGKLLHTPVQQLKAAAQEQHGSEAAEWLRRLFLLSLDDCGVDPDEDSEEPKR